MTTLSNLGAIARGQGRFNEAYAYLETSLELGKRHGLAGGRLYVLAEMGETARQKGDADSARAFFLEMLRFAQTTTVPPRLILPGLSYLAAFLAPSVAKREAFLLTAFVDGHAASPMEIKEAVKALRQRLEPELSPQIMARLETKAAALSLETLLARQLALLENESF